MYNKCLLPSALRTKKPILIFSINTGVCGKCVDLGEACTLYILTPKAGKFAHGDLSDTVRDFRAHNRHHSRVRT